MNSKRDGAPGMLGPNRMTLLLIVLCAVIACDPPPEAESPIDVALKPLASCSGNSDTALDAIKTLRFVVQKPVSASTDESEEAPEDTTDLLTTEVDREYSLGSKSGFTLGGIEVGAGRRVTVLGYSSDLTTEAPVIYGRAKEIQVNKDQRVDVAIQLSRFGGYSCLPTPEELTQRRVRGQVDGEALERLADGVFRAVADRGDLPAAQVLHHHALQEVVDVLGLELHVDLGVVGHLAVVLEEADAGVEQHHSLQRHVGRARPDGGGLNDRREDLLLGGGLSSWARAPDANRTRAARHPGTPHARHEDAAHITCFGIARTP